jgi:hypothetical protein
MTMATTNTTTILKFKSKRFDPAMNVGAGLFASKGTFDDKVLDLGWEKIPIEVIDKTYGHFQRCCIIKTNEEIVLAEITNNKLMQDLVKTVNAAASSAKAEKCKAARGTEKFVSKTCPYCCSTIVLSDFEESPQVYCRYCNTIFPKSGQVQEGEQDLDICSRCGFYSKPEDFFYMYIYFLLFVYAFETKQRVLCKGCEKEKAKRSCCMNSFTLIGLACALASMCKANQVQDMPAALAELDSANMLVKKGAKKCDTNSVNEGIRIYNEILNTNKVNAGVHYNLGLAYIVLKDYMHAAEAFEGALTDCSNYEPAVGVLIGCYEEMGGNSRKIAELKDLFDLHET